MSTDRAEAPSLSADVWRQTRRDKFELQGSDYAIEALQPGPPGKLPRFRALWQWHVLETCDSLLQARDVCLEHRDWGHRCR